MRRLYTALFYLAAPFVVARLLWRGLKAPAYRRRIAERFGYYPAVFDGAHVWFHAVSVGEAEAAFPLIRKLMERFPERRFVVTTTTPTGSRRVREVLGEGVAHVYLPYDLPGPVSRFLGAFRPRLAVVMETEIWPNLYLACAAAGIPLAMVNACLSERSARGYRRLRGLMGETLSAVTWVAAQTELDGGRFVALGAPPERVEVAGNLKFDLELPADLAERGRQLRSELFGGRPVVVAGSTHPGEEGVLLSVLAALRPQFPDLVLVLAPRRPERFAEVEALCRQAGFSATRRSDRMQALDGAVFLLDSLGELRLFYAAGDAAFVGGSLVPVGGHNVLEPAAAGVPVVFGPYTANVDEMVRGLLQGGGIQVADADGLAGALRGLLSDRAAAAARGLAARNFVERGRGTVGRVADRLAGWLAPGRAD